MENSNFQIFIFQLLSTLIYSTTFQFTYRIQNTHHPKHSHKSSISLFLHPIQLKLEKINLERTNNRNTCKTIPPKQNDKSTLPSPLQLFLLIYSKLPYLPFLESFSKHMKYTPPLTYLHLNKHSLNAFLILLAIDRHWLHFRSNHHRFQHSCNLLPQPILFHSTHLPLSIYSILIQIGDMRFTPMNCNRCNNFRFLTNLFYFHTVYTIYYATQKPQRKLCIAKG